MIHGIQMDLNEFCVLLGSAGEEFSIKARIYAIKYGLEKSPIRSLCWKFFLGCFSGRPGPDWKMQSREWRRQYQELIDGFLIDPHEAETEDLEISNPLSDSSVSSWNKYFKNQDVETNIKKDLNRLFTDIPFFTRPEVHDCLRRILLVWSLKNPETGYQQGMHEILACLYYVVMESSLYPLDFSDFPEDLTDEQRMMASVLVDALSKEYPEHDLFAMFDRIMGITSKWFYDTTKPPVEAEQIKQLSNVLGTGDLSADTLDSNGAAGNAKAVVKRTKTVHFSEIPYIVRYSRRVFVLLKAKDPALWEKINDFGIEPQYFLMRWLRMLFAREFELSEALRIWDAIFACNSDGSPFSDFSLIDYISVAMIKAVKSEICSTDTDENTCLSLLMHYPKTTRKDANTFIFQALTLKNNGSIPFDSVLYTTQVSDIPSLRHQKMSIKLERERMNEQEGRSPASMANAEDDEEQTVLVDSLAEDNKRKEGKEEKDSEEAYSDGEGDYDAELVQCSYSIVDDSADKGKKRSFRSRKKKSILPSFVVHSPASSQISQFYPYQSPSPSPFASPSPSPSPFYQKNMVAPFYPPHNLAKQVTSILIPENYKFSPIQKEILELSDKYLMNKLILNKELRSESQSTSCTTNNSCQIEEDKKDNENVYSTTESSSKIGSSAIPTSNQSLKDNSTGDSKFSVERSHDSQILDSLSNMNSTKNSSLSASSSNGSSFSSFQQTLSEPFQQKPEPPPPEMERLMPQQEVHPLANEDIARFPPIPPQSVGTETDMMHSANRNFVAERKATSSAGVVNISPAVLLASIRILEEKLTEERMIRFRAAEELKKVGRNLSSFKNDNENRDDRYNYAEKQCVHIMCESYKQIEKISSFLSSSKNSHNIEDSPFNMNCRDRSPQIFSDSVSDVIAPPNESLSTSEANENKGGAVSENESENETNSVERSIEESAKKEITHANKNSEFNLSKTQMEYSSSPTVISSLNAQTTPSCPLQGGISHSLFDITEANTRPTTIIEDDEFESIDVDICDDYDYSSVKEKKAEPEKRENIFAEQISEKKADDYSEKLNKRLSNSMENERNSDMFCVNCSTEKILLVDDETLLMELLNVSKCVHSSSSTDLSHLVGNQVLTELSSISTQSMEDQNFSEGNIKFSFKEVFKDLFVG
ncbi:Tre-2/Bub2/Cdc16 (TBC) F family protein A [Monocercomonoides exilis]|uniref:Tre-2/Bub2/Cdc16 (TBC) F family protein A n=1 Tax=Monocercomonoides exilis TaxID=2049356 RepID=UPI003559D82D|nr:Tre-2/Bub2/Cdc16 (TBC) F family protein A [Monocercomonoides exilis]|eukprot:MONOS_10070.1-p1 / transcript=MONOS_10070.1 / gene=MONOS_10070 / organism=Monocercomonoides_exilis_PA203 / gene_product=Tre-2/Bub2/Cdc16 (TBC) F family protein A / transcript_product=Tre-2/Bub2/Cdc16 (TBC) F family protein A / location=Mono_scaffold00442:458-4001(-) / protein_length=1159 / sequence_SO=supercontig / SO=protein_coding / is_pseudo=false